MNPLAQVLLLLSLQATPPQQPARFPDRWIAEDKAKHMLTSMAVVGFAHSGARMVSLKGNDALVAAAAGAAAAGIWKEFHDRSAGRPFSFRDLAWDAVGIGLGLLLVSHAR
jgi:uncharacterized protein YfiM (DUF2279 family)